MPYINRKYNVKYFYAPENYGFIIKSHYNADWIYCRDHIAEIWQSKVNSSRIIYFSHNGNGKQICNYLNKLEKKLKVKRLTNFGPSTTNKISWIVPSGFWTRNKLRKSLFTLLVRTIARCNNLKQNTSLDQVLNQDTLSLHTKYAIKRFLKGYISFKGSYLYLDADTDYIGNENYEIGWYEIFHYIFATKKQVGKVLVKPKIKNKKKSH